MSSLQYSENFQGSLFVDSSQSFQLTVGKIQNQSSGSASFSISAIGDGQSSSPFLFSAERRSDSSFESLLEDRLTLITALDSSKAQNTSLSAFFVILPTSHTEGVGQLSLRALRIEIKIHLSRLLPFLQDRVITFDLKEQPRDVGAILADAFAEIGTLKTELGRTQSLVQNLHTVFEKLLAEQRQQHDKEIAALREEIKAVRARQPHHHRDGSNSLYFSDSTCSVEHDPSPVPPPPVSTDNDTTVRAFARVARVRPAIFPVFKRTLSDDVPPVVDLVLPPEPTARVLSSEKDSARDTSGGGENEDESEEENDDEVASSGSVEVHDIEPKESQFSFSGRPATLSHLHPSMNPPDPDDEEEGDEGDRENSHERTSSFTAFVAKKYKSDSLTTESVNGKRAFATRRLPLPNVWHDSSASVPPEESGSHVRFTDDTLAMGDGEEGAKLTNTEKVFIIDEF